MTGARKPVEPRFYARIDRVESGCWLWTGYKSPAGYGVMSVANWPTLAHRISYELHVGPIPEGLEVDHLCRVRACVNPAHLEAVTHKVNSLRSEAPPAENARKTHCQNGHEFTPENTYTPPGNDWRYCRTCLAAKERRRQRVRAR